MFFFKIAIDQIAVNKTTVKKIVLGRSSLHFLFVFILMDVTVNRLCV